MDKIKATLTKRLTMKGLENNETGLFIRDILRIVSDRPELNIEARCVYWDGMTIPSMIGLSSSFRCVIRIINKTSNIGKLESEKE